MKLWKSMPRHLAAKEQAEAKRDDEEDLDQAGIKTTGRPLLRTGLKVATALIPGQADNIAAKVALAILESEQDDE